MRLKDKVALITGAASGIGRESALLFAAEGAAVVVADVVDDAGRATAEEIEKSGGRARFQHADVSSAADCESMIQAAESAFGKLDILFNNAGIMDSADGDAVSTEEAVWDRTMSINLKGVFFGCKYGIQALQRSGGGSTTGSRQCGWCQSDQSKRSNDEQESESYFPSR